VFITIGAFALTDREVSISTVAALLTIVGYSLNDNIVVFDRIRENLGRLSRRPFLEIINTSINEVVSRTVVTGLTTLIAAELTGTIFGLGNMIQEAQLYFRMDKVMLGIICIGIIGFMLDRLILYLEKKLTRWQ